MPTDAAYVDTSVLGAYYCPEPISDAAEAALLGLRDGTTPQQSSSGSRRLVPANPARE